MVCTTDFSIINLVSSALCMMFRSRCSAETSLVRENAEEWYSLVRESAEE